MNTGKRFKTEKELIEDFINSGIVRGWFLQEIPVGIKVLEDILSLRHSREELEILRKKLGPFLRRIDLVCVEGIDRPPLKPRFHEWLRIREELRGHNVWIFEAKKVLNAEALGEILINEYLFRKDNPEINVVGKGIICGTKDVQGILIGEACKAYGVKIFDKF